MKIALLALFITYAVALPSDNEDIIPVPGGRSGWGTTTRYWDCCKPSCAWVENIKTRDMHAVNTCDSKGINVLKPSVKSGCDGGSAYMCNNQQPFVVNKTLAYGFAAASFTGGVDTNLCCACFLLTFQGQLSGKQLLVQNTNSGGDLGANQFDIATPGGGVGIFTSGCHDQWNAPWSGWGDQYGGVHSAEECNTLPQELQSGCRFRFEFMENVSNPQVQFQQVVCPKKLVEITGCNL
nr:endoglucanase-like [Leptinotarsa decemlineata]